VHHNKILRQLSGKANRLIIPHLRPVTLRKDLVLYEAGQRLKHVYFPDQAVISCLSSTVEGGSIEVCLIGHEGVVGLSAVLSNRTMFRAVVQIPGTAYTLDCDLLRRELAHCEPVHNLLLNYMGGLLVQLAQAAVCNRFHSVDKRFSRWLLAAHDRAPGNRIPMTQDAMARILGSRRASVSGVAASFQKKGMLEYSRGVIRILDRKSLESETCECYQTISSTYR
jgi:CRP-like cAMP-binding protein